MSEITVFLRHAKRSHSNDIDLSKRELSFLPKQLLTMRNIEYLNLANNKLEHIDPSIAELFKLKELNLSNNLLAEIPSEISSLPLLGVLRLEGNPLKPQFQHLALPQNQRNSQLAQALRQCFEADSKQKTPEWLIEAKGAHSNASDILWDQSIFKVERQVSRKGEGRHARKAEEECESVFKNGVLQIKLQDLKIGAQISMGGFSTIHRGTYIGQEVAIKKVFNPNISQQLMAEFSNQISMLSKYRHPNIVLLMGAITTPPTLCIVMQLCREGTLYDLLHRKKSSISQKQKAQIIVQIINVVQYLHRHGIVHRDIKSHNVLINSFLQIKLCDFGLARHKLELNTGPMQYSGTPTYMAQELFQKKNYDMSVDIFALGTLFYEIYTCEVPYHGIDPADIKQKVLKDHTLPFKVEIKKPTLQMINKCRSQDPSSRPSIDELAEFNEW